MGGHPCHQPDLTGLTATRGKTPDVGAGTGVAVVPARWHDGVETSIFQGVVGSLAAAPCQAGTGGRVFVFRCYISATPRSG